MLLALFSFGRSDVLRRLRQILVSSEVVLALFAAVGPGIWGSRLPIGKTSTGDVVLALLSYAAIAFGFSVAGLTLVLTAPDESFAHLLAWADPSKRGRSDNPPEQNSYSNLLFIFSWTAIAHWAVVVGGFALLVVLGNDNGLIPDGSSTRHRLVVGVVAFCTVYAIELFLITVITLSQVGSTYIARLQAKPPSPPTP